MVSAGFKTIRVDLHRFCWNFVFFVDLGSLEWIRIDLGIFEFGLVNLIGVV